MREYYDKATGITWVTPEVSKIEFNTPQFIEPDKKILDDFTRELNENAHNDHAICEFVTGGDIGLGSFMSWALDKWTRPFYAFDEGRLVGTADIEGRTGIDANALETYITYRENKGNLPNDMQDFLPLDRARKILAHASDENNTDISYIVVIPKAQGRGVGTRMLASIKNNPQFFSFNPFTKTTSAIVHKNNIPSQTMFKRNNFFNYTLDLKRGISNFHDYICETPVNKDDTADFSL